MKTFYRRHLPHIYVPGATYFITFRLANSLPVEVVIRLKQDKENEEKRILSLSDKHLVEEQLLLHRKKHFVKFDKYLDSAVVGNFWLKKQRLLK